MKEEYRKIVNELLGLPEDSEINFEGATDTAVTNLMICKRLDRIADVLEDINGALISMGGDIEALGECVGTIPTPYTKGKACRFLHIGGSIDTGV